MAGTIMDTENLWKLFGGGALGVIFILALAKLFNTAPYKKNGNGHSMMDEIMGIGRNLSDNATKQTMLLSEIHETNKDNGRKLDSLSSNLALAMERQITTSQKIDKLSK